MTIKEKKVYAAWKSMMLDMARERDEAFAKMQTLVNENGGKASCCLEGNLDYLLHCDSSVSGRALFIYRKHYEANAQYEALTQLEQAFEDA